VVFFFFFFVVVLDRRLFGVQAVMNNALMGILRVRDLSSPPYLDVTPAVSRLQVQPEDKFVVIGSDGLYDFFSNEEVVEHINRFFIQQPSGDPAKYMIEQLLLRAAANAGNAIQPSNLLCSVPNQLCLFAFVNEERSSSITMLYSSTSSTLCW
jgi:hypothetical protein